MITNEEIKWIGFAASIATLVTVAINLCITMYEKKTRNKEVLRRKEQISIQLSDGKRIIVLPGVVPREQLTRSEVMGRIGAVPKKKPAGSNEQKRYSLLYTNKAEFLDRIEELYYSTGKGQLLSVECSKEEIDQFDIEVMKLMEFELIGLD